MGDEGRMEEAIRHQLYDMLRTVHSKGSEAFMAILQGNTTCLATSHSFDSPPEGVELGMPAEITVTTLTVVLPGPIEENPELTDALLQVCKPYFPDSPEMVDPMGSGDLTKVTDQ